MTITLVEIEAYDPVGDITSTLRYCSGSGYNHPSAPGYYAPRVHQGLSLRQWAFQSGRSWGASRVDIGEIRLVNRDGGLSGLSDLIFDGRPARVLIGSAAASIGAFTVLATGTVSQPHVSDDIVTFRFRDAMALLDGAAQTRSYAGDNALPLGVEGTADDLGGRRKPVALGAPMNVPMPLVNTSKWVFQAADGPVEDVAAVYIRGSALGRGVRRADVAALLATVPAAGFYDWCATAAGSYVRLSAADGDVTADLLAGTGAAGRSAARLFETLLTERAGVAAADIDAGDLAALDAQAPGIVDLWLGCDERRLREVLDDIAASAGAWYGVDSLGRWHIRRLSPPAGNPVLSFRRFGVGVAAAAEADILAIERLTPSDSSGGAPAKSVTQAWGKNHIVQRAGELAGSVSPARSSWLKEELRSIKITNANATLWPSASDLEFPGLSHDFVSAQALAQHRLELYAQRRELLRLRARLEADVAALAQLGATVAVTDPSLKLSGKRLVILGREVNTLGGWIELELWG